MLMIKIENLEALVLSKFSSQTSVYDGQPTMRQQGEI